MFIFPVAVNRCGEQSKDVLGRRRKFQIHDYLRMDALDEWFLQPCNLYFGMLAHLFFFFFFSSSPKWRWDGTKSSKDLKVLNTGPREVNGIWQMQDLGSIQASTATWVLLCHRCFHRAADVIPENVATALEGQVESAHVFPCQDGTVQNNSLLAIVYFLKWEGNDSNLIIYSPVLKVNRLNLAFDYVKFCFMAKCVLLISQLQMSALMSSKNLDLKMSPFFSHQNFLI